MADTRSNQPLMALLALDEDSSAPSDSAQTASLPTLDQRVEMYLHAVYGPGAAITAEMRSAARDRLLDAMADDLADETAGPVPAAQAIPAARSVAAATAAPVSAGLSQLWHSIVSGLQQLVSPAAEASSVRGLRMAAVPLLALFVVGSVWTGYWINEIGPTANLPAGNGATEHAPMTRSLAPQDTATEQNLKRTIAADEAALGPTNPAVASKLIDLASLYRSDGRYGEAEALCTRALAIQQRALGPDNPETIRALNELAMVYRAQGRAREADDLLAHANGQ